jgi:Uncharacterized protein conserved in bacteria (DUF2325)
MDEHRKNSGETPPIGSTKRRLKLWEMTGGMQCSIIGTCLSHADLMALAKRNRVDVPDDIAEYEVHGFFVGEASRDGPIARAISKALDQRFEGAIRIAHRCTCAHALGAYWREQRDIGRVAAAYWAVLTAPALSHELRAVVFGEVHMLSHLQGHAARSAQSKVSDLDARVHDLEERLARETQRHAAALAERDEEIAQLRQRRCEAVSRDMLRPIEIPPRRTRDDRQNRHRQRALAATRERARTAESQIAVLRERLQRLELLLAHTPATPAGCPAADTLATVIEADKRRVLYVGGRQSAMEKLHDIARRANAELLHHDGGLEQATARIDALVAGCDVVFCPIDCVSHAACQRAKALCRRHNKPFVPLRSSGASTFARALGQIEAV